MTKNFFLFKLIVYGHEVNLTILDSESEAEPQGVSAVVLVFSCNKLESLQKMIEKVCICFKGIEKVLKLLSLFG